MFNIFKRNKPNDCSSNVSESNIESSSYPTCSNERENLLNQPNYQSINSVNSKKFNKCPTCNGTGKVCKDDKVNLVALIPLTDKRLKPRRIWTWVLLTIAICALLGSLIALLLAPRPIKALNEVVYIEPYNVSLIKDGNSSVIGFTLTFEESFDLVNSNYYSIHMRNLTLQIDRDSHRILPKLFYHKDFKIPALTRKIFKVKVKYSMYLLDDPYAGLCVKGLLNNLFSSVSTSFSFATLWNLNEQINLNTLQYISCKNVSTIKY